MKKTVLAGTAAALAGIALLTGCGVNDADVVSKNIAKEADNFQINRRIVIINNESDKVIQMIEGWCNAEVEPDVIRTTCKVPGGYHKHINGRNNNTTFSIQQLDAANVSKDHYKVTFKPSVVIPDVDMR